MSKVLVSELKQRGDHGQIVVRDITRVTNPVIASIFTKDGEWLVIPESDRFPVVARDNLSSAVDFVERIIPE